MNRWKAFLLAGLALVILGAIYGAVLMHGGFSAKEEPSAIEKLAALTVRNLWLRTLPRTGKRTCSQADAREYHQSRAAGLRPGQ